MHPIERHADGVKVIWFRNGHPLTFRIEHHGGDTLRLFGIEQAEGLHYALGKILEATKKERD